MNLHPGIFFGVAILLASGRAFPAVYYVSPDGNNSSPGTIDKPFASMQKGHDVAMAGDTVFLRGGTYTFRGQGANSNAGIYITKSGQSDTRRICFFAYKDEKPVLDFSGLSLATSTSAGIRIDGSKWLHFRGLEICNVPQPGGSANNGIWCNPGSNIIFERLNLHHNAGPGLSIANGEGGHLVLNCDSHHNYDSRSTQGDGQNADGFGIHYQKTGPSTVLRGCRSWWNSDDGFDCIHQGVAVVVESCWNALNGYKPGTMTSAPSGNGNGFKVGGWGNPPSGYPDPIPRHTVRFCMAFLNKEAGFYQNHQPISNYYYNNTAFGNKAEGFNMLGYDLNRRADAGMGIYRNNVSLNETPTANGNGADAANNSWNLSGLTVTADDFMTIDTAGVFGARKPDGSLPDIPFMRLSAQSRLINKGVNVELPFTGAAPDLGAFEYGTGTTRLLRARAGAPKGLSILPAGAAGYDPAGRRRDLGAGLRPVVPLFGK